MLSSESIISVIYKQSFRVDDKSNKTGTIFQLDSWLYWYWGNSPGSNTQIDIKFNKNEILFCQNIDCLFFWK